MVRYPDYQIMLMTLSKDNDVFLLISHQNLCLKNLFPLRNEWSYYLGYRLKHPPQI